MPDGYHSVQFRRSQWKSANFNLSLKSLASWIVSKLLVIILFFLSSFHILFSLWSLVFSSVLAASSVDIEWMKVDLPLPWSPFPSSSFWPFNLHQFMEVIPLTFHYMTNTFFFFHYAVKSIWYLFTPRRICAGIIFTNEHEVAEVEFLYGALIEQHNPGSFRTLGWALLTFLAVWAMCNHKQINKPTLV